MLFLLIYLGRKNPPPFQCSYTPTPDQFVYKYYIILITFCENKRKLIYLYKYSMYLQTNLYVAHSEFLQTSYFGFII